jgi:hypothetical protein
MSGYGRQAIKVVKYWERILRIYSCLIPKKYYCEGKDSFFKEWNYE